MTKRGIAICLGAAVAFQVVVLAGMVAKAAMPLWTGTEIRVKTIPVDPRSMFRGNYARLRYEFGTLPDGALNEVEGLRVGEVVYVSLEQGEGGDYVFAGVSMERPADGICLRGRLVRNSPPLRVKYGIEAFFAPKERALKLESDLRDGGTAVLMVTDGGRAALKDVIPNPDSGSGSGRGHSQSRGVARCPVFEPGSRRTRDVSSYRNPITGVQARNGMRLSPSRTIPVECAAVSWDRLLSRRTRNGDAASNPCHLPHGQQRSPPGDPGGL